MNHLNPLNHGSDNNNQLYSMKNLVYLIALSVILGFVIKVFAFEVFTVPTDSMEPTIKTGSKVWLNKIKLGAYKRGDIIGFEHNRENFVKRITGLPNEYVNNDGDKYFTNKVELVNPPPLDETGHFLPETETIRDFFIIPKTGDTVKFSEYNFDFYKPLIENCEHIPAGKILNKIFINSKEANYYVFKQNYYFVEGDNKAVSVDSRTFGLISENQIIGKTIGIK